MRWILVGMVLAMALLGRSALAVDVVIHNCMGTPLRVITYDEDDLVRMIPYAEYELPGTTAGIVQCKGRTACQITMFYGDVGESYKSGGPLFIRYSWMVGIYRGTVSCNF